VVSPDSAVTDMEEMHRIAYHTVNQISAQTILDARQPEEFEAGHLTGATNIPYTELLNEDGTFKSNSELYSAFTRF
jgi:3-mercaptopyruvate sulfurtransferase SseA